MFPKNEKHRFSVSDIFSTLLRPCFFQWSKTVCVNFHRPTYQEFTPTSNIALLILCSRQAIVPLCRPGGVRAARFNKAFQWVQHHQNLTFSEVLAHPGAKKLDFGTSLAPSAQNGVQNPPRAPLATLWVSESVGLPSRREGARAAQKPRLRRRPHETRPGQRTPPGRVLESSCFKDRF